MKLTVSDASLTLFVRNACESAGMAPAHALMVADALVWANLRGVDSHGVMRLPRYLEMIDQGLMNVRPDMTSSAPTPNSLRIEGDRAPGPVAMNYAIGLLIEQTKQHGLAMALVSRMTHTGALGHYTQRLAGAGLACIAVNAGIPMMPYFGAVGAALGTNPISIAVPGGGDDPLLFDMANSAVSLGKLMLSKRTGADLQPGWAVDKEGRPTTDPAEAAMALPLAGPKGSGLALMIECLASLLTGHPLVADALQKTGDGAKHRQNAMLIAIDVSRFVDLAEFRQQVQRLADSIKALPLAPDSQAILMPGERGFRTMGERRSSGIPIPPQILVELGTIAERYNIDPLVTAH